MTVYKPTIRGQEFLLTAFVLKGGLWYYFAVIFG